MGISNGSRKIVGISLFIFWAVVTAVIVTGFFLYKKDPVKPDPASLLPNGSGSIVLNAQEISKHTSHSDCWITIDNKVYNITNYLGAHPGGASIIVSYCGKDGTQAFQGLPHSSYAGTLLNNYYIGDLNQTTSTEQIRQNEQGTIQAIPLTKREDHEEEGGDD